MNSRRRLAGRSATSALDRELKVEPLPGPSLSAHIRPPISSARRRLIARPRPVPPYLRVVLESACENDWNRRPMPSALRPMPVSRTRKRQHRALARERLAAHRDDDLAALGELDRVGEQVEQDLAQPGHVAADRRRHVALEDVGDVETLLGRARADQVERRLDALAQVERMRLDVHPPGLDLREVEDVVDDRQQRVARVADGRGEVALLVVERRVEQQTAHADHGVHRRADLVAHRRQERALGLVRGLGGGARFLRLPEQARVLDRDHGLVGEGLAAARPPCR